jgi:hypothetical protein
MRDTLRLYCALALLITGAPSLAQTENGSQARGQQQAKNIQPEMMSRQQITAIIATTRKIVSPNGVEELYSIQINGSTQWLSVRG